MAVIQGTTCGDPPVDPLRHTLEPVLISRLEAVF